MAPFFKSSSLFTISRRRSKVKTSSDNLDSSPRTILSRSLPNMEELHGISSRFIEEFHPIVQRQVPASAPAVASSDERSAASENIAPKESADVPTPLDDSEPVTSLESTRPQAIEDPITSPRPLFDDVQSILTIASNSDEDAVSVSISEQSDSPIDEASSTHVSSSISPKLQDESTSRVPPPAIPSLEDNLDGDSTPRASSYAISEPSSDPIPSLERDLAKPDEKPIHPGAPLDNETPEPFTRRRGMHIDMGGFPNPPDITFEEEETLVAVKGDESSLTTLPSIEQLTPRKSTPPLSRTKTMSITSSREAEQAAFLRQLDDFAVFFGVEKPSKIAYAPPLTYVHPLRPHRSGADCGCDHKEASYEASIASYEESIASYKESMASYERTVECLERDVSEYEKSNCSLQNTQDTLNHELEDLKAEYYIQKLQNVKLNKAISDMKYDFIRILQRQDWEMAQMKRFIAAMIDIDLHIPVLYNANDLLEKGTTADVALITAIKDAAENIGSPWATIIPAIVGKRPDELYLSAIKRSAKLSNELREATKKYQYWKKKAQMERRHAKHITPSSSTLSLFANAWLSAQPPEKDEGCLDNLLHQLESGEARTWNSRPSMNSNSVVAGPSEIEEPESGCIDDLLNQIKSGNMSTLGSQRTITIPHRVKVDLEYIDRCLNQILSGEIIRSSRSSTITSPITPGPSKFDEAYISPTSPCTSGVAEAGILVEALVELDQILSLPETPGMPALPEVSSIEIAQMALSPETLETPSSPVETIMPSPVPFNHAFSTGEESVLTIRPYIPGRALFGEDGLAIIPSGFFSKSDHDASDSPALSATNSTSAPTEEFTMAENVSYISGSQESLGLVYIDEEPIEKFEHEDLPDSHVLSISSSASPFTEEFTFIENASYVSASAESIGMKYIDEIPLDGRCNPILRDDSDDGSITGPEFVPQDTKVSHSSKDAVNVAGPPEIVQSTSRPSLNSLKRLSANSSKLKQSISSGLKRLISFGPRKPEQAESAALKISRPKALHTHYRKSSTLGKENRTSNPKHMGSAMPRGVRRPTVSSALKAVDSPLSAVPPSIKTHRKQNTVTFESPRPTIASSIKAHKRQNTVTLESSIVSSPLSEKRVPLSNLPLLCNNSQKASTPRKAIEQGRRAVRTLAKLIS